MWQGIHLPEPPGQTHEESLWGESMGRIQITCSLCGEAFFSWNHLKSHDWDIPIHCALCGKVLISRNHLTRHMKSHTRGNQYHCAPCAEGFISLNHLKRHMKSYTWEYPYHCCLCGEGFVSLNHLSRHLNLNLHVKTVNSQQLNKIKINLKPRISTMNKLF